MKLLPVATLLLSLAAASLAPSRAADLAISIDPMVFEFTASYGAQAQGTIWITNPGRSSEIVFTRPVEFNTSTDGSVELRYSGKNAGTHSLTRYLQITPAYVTLASGETRAITIQLHMPAAGQQKVLWGGLLFQTANASGAATSVAPGATVLVYDSAVETSAHLALTGFHLQQQHGHAQFIADVINDSEGYARPAARLVLERHGVFVSSTDVAMNALFPGGRRVLLISPPRVPPGSYEAHLLIRYGSGSILDGETHVRIP